ncbi:hypothetical protein QCA50_001282 [Cerrena zonata]|uniref:Uncharacterized protein n=1 Tax=Cerrena zonata TaxID=2478898 RepID=A0AAW0H0X8_9APHY
MSVGDILPRNSYGNTDITAGLVSLSERQRPNLVRRDTDHILSYYHSEHAGRDIYDVKAVEDYLSMEPHAMTLLHAQIPPQNTRPSLKSSPARWLNSIYPHQEYNNSRP